MMVFIDDRSFCARSAPALLSWIEHWQTWSNLVGLRESMGKIQVVAKTAKQRRELYQASGGRYNQVDATFLGSPPGVNHVGTVTKKGVGSVPLWGLSIYWVP